MKKIFVLISFVFLFFVATSEAAVTGPVFFAIQPQYQDARDFHEGLAAVKQNDRWGYIDYLGRIAVPIIYRIPEAGDFSEGFAFVGDHYIDIEGVAAFTLVDEDTDERIEKFFTNGLPFSQGLAAVQSGGEWGYIDLAGNYVIAPSFRRAGSFKEDLAPVMARDGLWGYIDVRGNYVIEPKFLRAFEFNEGLARVNIKGRWGFINKEGKVVIKASYYEAGDFNFGLAPVRTRRSYRGWGFISTRNKFSIPRWFNNLRNFGDGIAPAAADARWGFVNVRGEWEISPQFEDARSFSEGLAAVKVENQWGFIRQ
ncbi:MAG: WG repeat-containing protein [Synergistaceae bacterium]|nr:WG repeat-containing protein [Synergistaceae bacterium]